MIKGHAKSFKVKFNIIQENFFVNDYFLRTFLATAKIKHAPFELRKMDTTEQGEECLSTAYCDDYSQTISLVKLLAAFFPTTKCLLESLNKKTFTSTKY